jgi:hypothetical protein
MGAAERAGKELGLVIEIFRSTGSAKCFSVGRNAIMMLSFRESRHFVFPALGKI